MNRTRMQGCNMARVIALSVSPVLIQRIVCGWRPKGEKGIGRSDGTRTRARPPA